MNMSTVKELVREVVETQPEDASYEEIMRELAFDRMVNRGMEDVRHGRVMDDEEMSRRIRQWQS
jgi:predicted transcriptional regulator